MIECNLFLDGITLSGRVTLYNFNSTPLFSISAFFNIYKRLGTSDYFLNGIEFNKLHRVTRPLISLVSLLYNISTVVLLIVNWRRVCFCYIVICIVIVQGNRVESARACA